MTEYVTVADVDSQLGEAWAPADKKGEAVLIANVWMTNQRLPNLDPMPDAWPKAAGYVAREAAKGNIYGQTEKGLTGKSVKADTVEVSKTFADGHKIVSAGEALALAMLERWTRGMGNVRLLKRI